jgi:ATP-binding cassette subfamily C protein
MSKANSIVDFAAGLRIFLRDFAAFAGVRGIFTAALVGCGAVLEGLSLVVIVPMLAIVIEPGAPTGRLGRAAAAVFHSLDIETPFGQLTLLLALFGVLMIIRAVIVSRRDVAVAELRTGFIEAQRLRIAERLAATRWDKVVQLRHARIVHSMSDDIQRIGMAASFVLQSGVALAMLLAQCALVFLLAPVLGVVAVAVLGLGTLLFIPVLRRAHFFGGAMSGANLNLLDMTGQFLGGLKLAISQNLQSSFMNEFRQTLGDLNRMQIDYVRQQTNRRLALSTFSAFAAAALVLIGYGVFAVPAPTLITLLLIMSRMIGPVTQIQQGAQQLVHSLPAYSNAKALADELGASPANTDVVAQNLPPPEGPIAFEAVTFTHAEVAEGDVAQGIRGITLSIVAGQFVGLTGPSGGGKTTFADLLVGLYPPQEGQVSVGGRPLQGAVLAAWRDAVSYVSQDAFLFHDTVERNLIWAKPSATADDLWQALELAGAGDLVRRLPLQLKTLVGERGTLLSGGERQRIALARALLRKPRLLMLDEATSAIDVAGEHKILQSLRDLSPRPAIVMVAHRAESLALCERLLRLENGILVEDRTIGHG